MRRVGEGSVIMINQEKKYLLIQGKDGGLYIGELLKDVEEKTKIIYEIEEESRKAIKIKRLEKF